MVFVGHAGSQLNRTLVPVGFGVTVFFFLSGYLITTLLRQEWEKSARIRLRAFYLRRVYRILPPMYLVLLFAVAMTGAGLLAGHPARSAVVAQFAHLTNYYVVVHGYSRLIPDTLPYWSLSVEEHFYLIYPLMLGLLLRNAQRKRVAWILLGACAAVLAWRCILVFGLGQAGFYTSYATDARIDSLLFGCAMAVGWNPALDDPSPPISERLWPVVCAVAVAMLCGSFLLRDTGLRETVRYTIQGVALGPLFYCAIRFSRWPVFRWLNWSWVRALGLVSYTFYLVHLPMLQLARDVCGGASLGQTCLAFAGAVGFAALSYLTIEKHFAKLRKRLHH